MRSLMGESGQPMLFSKENWRENIHGHVYSYIFIMITLTCI